MAATVVITSHHGATGATQTNVDGTSIRYKQADNDTVDANNPIPIPGAGTNYSYIKQLRFNCTVAPSNTINNLKFYSDGANGFGTGMDLLCKTTSSYVDPTTQTTTLVASQASVFTYTSGSPLAVTGSTSGTGLFGDYVLSQFSVTTTAGQGTTPSEVLTFSYDES
jgi:hypothetical protein